MPRKKFDVAVVQMASWGDVVISTLIPRAIKEQRPDWAVTYYTSSACAGAVSGNPDIDNLEIIQATKDQAWGIQDRVIAQARQKHDKVITPWAGWYPQHDWVPLRQPGWEGDYSPNFMWAYVRTAQLNDLTIANPPTIYLHPTPEECGNAGRFVSTLPHRRRVLMEVEGHSSQSWMNQSWLRPMCSIIMGKYGGEADVLISKGGGETPEIAEAKTVWPGRVHLLNNYSLREVAVIFNSCDVFIGCSSGTSNACHAHFCRKDLQWFEVTRNMLWDSRPLRSTGKHHCYAEDPNVFFELLRDNLR